MSRIMRLLTSSKVFWIVCVFFVIEAIWIAVTGAFPMAFDEQFHLGIIKIYAHHVSPFLTHQPSNADEFGAVFRDPSYLYQYIMSFPYRLINLFIHTQTAQIIALRFINIALFTSSLPIFRRLLVRSKLSPALINVLFMVFVLVPVVPLLAAQINYDNLFMPLVATALLLTVKLSDEIKAKDRLNAKLISGLFVVCLLASLVQYEFLPIFLAIVVYVSYLLYMKWHHYSRIWSAFLRSYHVLNRNVKLILLLFVVLASGLFIQRYGINTISYKTPVPDCAKVIGPQKCSAYSPWERNYLDAHTKINPNTSPILFTSDWFYGLWMRSFFAVAGSNIDYQTRGPLLIPSVSAIVFAVIGVGLFLIYAKRIFKKYNPQALWFFIIMIGCYLAALWMDNYLAFVKTGQPVAINGRYLVPLLLPIMVFAALGFAEFFKSKKLLQKFKPLAAIVVVLCFLWGGGVFTYILRSNYHWYWKNDHAATTVNRDIRNAIKPYVPGSRNPTLFLL